MDWSRILEEQRRRLGISGSDALLPISLEAAGSTTLPSLRGGPQNEFPHLPANLLRSDALGGAALRAAPGALQAPALDYVSLALPQHAREEMDFLQARQRLLLEEETRLRQEVLTRALRNSALQQSRAGVLGMLNTGQSSQGPGGLDVVTAVREAMSSYEHHLLRVETARGKVATYRGVSGKPSALNVAAAAAVERLQRILPVSRPRDRGLTFPLPSRTGIGQARQISQLACFKRLWVTLTEGPSNLSNEETSLFVREFFARRIGRSDNQARLYRRFHGLEGEPFDGELQGRNKRKVGAAKLPSYPSKKPSR